MTLDSDHRIWQTETLTRNYLDGVRRALPLAAEQIDLMLRIARAACPTVERFLDLGCGDGILGHAVLEQYPQASGVFLDFSEPMLEAAQKRLASFKAQLTFVVQDYGDPDWVGRVQMGAPFDLIVSGFSIHHQPDPRKQAIYQEVYDLLKPGGLFLNLEHVASSTKWVEHRFDDLMVDALYSHHMQNGGEKSREEIGRIHYYRPDKAANILAPVQVQSDWLRAIGFTHVDCYFKLFELALFGGVRPG